MALLLAFGSRDTLRPTFADLNGRHRMEIAEFGGAETVALTEEARVDLEKIKNQKGQVVKASIEDVMIAIANLKGDAVKGKALFAQQGCVACHSLGKGEKRKGPFVGQIGSIMTRVQIAESILNPNASISQGFASVLITARGDKSYMGFITKQSADRTGWCCATSPGKCSPLRPVTSSRAKSWKLR